MATIERPSASDGERAAAEVIAAELRALGCETAIEVERAHGTYWWPIGLANTAAAVAGAIALGRGRGRARLGAALIAGAAATALWDDLSQNHRWLRRILPRHATYNVVARTGDPEARRAIVLIAHHDAAHSGLVFHPALGRLGPRIAPRLHERSSHTTPILYGVWLGPVAISLGALTGCRRLMQLGVAFAVGATAAMADIGRSAVVPGASDNLAAVGAILALAEAFQRQPVDGARVLLLSTGSEESFSEGMSGFLARHGDELDPAQTEMLCLECLGAETLSVLEGEGMLRMRDYLPELRDALADAADAAEVPIARGLRSVAATDALVAMRAGYPVVTLASVDATKLPRNYHWPTDVPGALRWQTVRDGIAVCERFVRMRAQHRGAP